jgi:hypothetical protein
MQAMFDHSNSKPTLKINMVLETSNIVDELAGTLTEASAKLKWKTSVYKALALELKRSEVYINMVHCPSIGPSKAELMAQLLPNTLSKVTQNFAYLARRA